MILKDEIFSVGQITKSHGTKGELAFTTNSNILEEVDVPFVILEPQGILVPFYIENIRMKTDTTGLIKLERIDNHEQARELVSQTIYLPNVFLEEMEDTEFEMEYFIGFEAIDVRKGNIGKVIAVDDSTANALFVLEGKSGEVLIPIADEFISEIDHKKKIIRLSLPEGLLEL